MKVISNKEKAKEIAHDYFRRGQLGLVAIDTESAGFECAMEAMKWKEQQMTDKAVELVEKYLFEIGYPDDWLRDSPNITNGKTRFIKAMKGD